MTTMTTTKKKSTRDISFHFVRLVPLCALIIYFSSIESPVVRNTFCYLSTSMTRYIYVCICNASIQRLSFDQNNRLASIPTFVVYVFFASLVKRKRSETHYNNNKWREEEMEKEEEKNRDRTYERKTHINTHIKQRAIRTPQHIRDNWCRFQRKRKYFYFYSVIFS